MTSRSPRLWVIAGPNGAGKSSIVGARIGGRLPIVNPDDIARDAAEDNPAAAAERVLASRRH
jgi:predicted ABC-type ATPase